MVAKGTASGKSPAFSDGQCDRFCSQGISSKDLWTVQMQVAKELPSGNSVAVRLAERLAQDYAICKL